MSCACASADEGNQPLVRVVVLDQYELVRRAVSQVLATQRDIDVVDGVTAADSADIDVVVTDLGPEPLEGHHEAVASIITRFPEASVVVATAGTDIAAVLQAIEAGAAGVVSLNANAQELVDAVRRAGRGERYIEGRLAAELAAQSSRRDSAPRLTRRETDVIRLVAAGFTNSEVGRALDIALRTVEAHRSNAVHKLGLRTRADVVRYCQEAGLLPVRPSSEAQATV